MRDRKARAVPGQAKEQTFNKTIIAVVVVAVVGLGILLYFSLRPEPPIEGVVVYPRQRTGHDDTLQIAYGELPPVGGLHNNQWQNCGIYTEPVVKPENAVHSLEHGVVWITFQPDLDSEELEKLKELARADDYILLSPYPNQRSPIVMTAWGVQLELTSADDDRVAEFITKYEHGLQAPERLGSCVDGVGTPVEQ